MSSLESDSRANATGRKRRRHDQIGTSLSNKSQKTSSVETLSGASHTRRSSTESGEISSSESIEDDLQHSDTVSSSSKASAFADDSSDDDDHNNGLSERDAASNRDDSPHAEPSDVDGARDRRRHASHQATHHPSRHREVQLRDLSQADQDDQYRYFQLSRPDAPVYCLCCGARGHQPSTCPARTCVHCGAIDAHAAVACPRHRKCARCRQRGHDAVQCGRGGSASSARAADDACDICTTLGHVEEECPWLWGPPPVRLSREEEARRRKNCYACGGAHDGVECPRRDRAGPGAFAGTASAHREVYVAHSDEDDDDAASVGDRPRSGRQRPGRGGASWQRNLLDDGRD